MDDHAKLKYTKLSTPANLNIRETQLAYDDAKKQAIFGFKLFFTSDCYFSLFLNATHIENRTDHLTKK